jgi:hypothetical protein
VELNPFPVIVTKRVTGPEVGERLVIVGAEASTENVAAAEPVDVVTVTAVGPERAVKAI